VLKVPLDRPKRPIYPTLPSDSEVAAPLENWISAIMDAPRWHDRAKVILSLVKGQMEFAKELELGGMPRDIQAIFKALPYQVIITASLEHLAEAEIDCLQAAAFYALSEHEQRWCGRPPTASIVPE
jgi:hypothetical protein